MNNKKKHPTKEIEESITQKTTIKHTKRAEYRRGDGVKMANQNSHHETSATLPQHLTLASNTTIHKRQAKLTQLKK